MSEKLPQAPPQALQIFYGVLLRLRKGIYILRCFFHVAEKLLRYLGVCRFYPLCSPEAISFTAVRSHVIAQKGAVAVLDNVLCISLTRISSSSFCSASFFTDDLKYCIVSIPFSFYILIWLLSASTLSESAFKLLFYFIHAYPFFCEHHGKVIYEISGFSYELLPVLIFCGYYSLGGFFANLLEDLVEAFSKEIACIGAF